MNFEKSWSALLAAISAENDYHDFKKAEIAILMLRALADPDELLAEVTKQAEKEEEAV